MAEETTDERRRQKNAWYHRNRDRLKLQRDLGIDKDEAEKWLQDTKAKRQGLLANT